MLFLHLKPEVKQPSWQTYMDKLERIGCLYLTFLNGGGLTFAAIRTAMPQAYAGEAESARRKFERDKEELKSLGISLQHFAPGDVLPDGRLANDHVYYPEELPEQLPEIELTSREAEELSRLLLRAMQQSNPDKSHAADKLDQNQYDTRARHLHTIAAKLLYRNPEYYELAASQNQERLQWNIPRSPDNELESKNLSGIHLALKRNKYLQIYYKDRKGIASERQIACYGLTARRGRWSVIAYCKKAAGIRAFYVNRIESVELLSDSFSSDPNFKIEDYKLHPLTVRVHSPISVQIEIRDEAQERFENFIEGAGKNLQLNEVQPNRYHFMTSNQDALFRHIFTYPTDTLALGPPTLLQNYIQFIKEVQVHYV